MALDGALHDWIGKRAGLPVWRLLGVTMATMPQTSYTIGIDTVEGTADKTRRAQRYGVLKVKVGGADDLARLEVIREHSQATLRIDGNEGWTLETARELMPALIELGVEFVEQPFPADDLESFRGLRELKERIPVVIDEGCKNLASVAPIATYADGINIKISKCGGIREAVRMTHAARALGIGVMLGCMIESELGIGQALQLAPLVDWVDLDGHLLIKDGPFRGLGFEDGRVVLVRRAGHRGRAGMSERLAIYAEGQFETLNGKTGHGVIRYAPREIVAVIDSGNAGRTADEVVPYCARPVPIVATVAEAAALGADRLLIGVAPDGGRLSQEWRIALGEAMALGMDVEAGLHSVLADDPDLVALATQHGRRADRPARRPRRPRHARRPVQARPVAARHPVGRIRLRDRQDDGHARARQDRPRARRAQRLRRHRPDRASPSPAGASPSTT